MSDLASEIKALCSQRDTISLRLSRLVADFDARRGYQADGCANTVAWLKVQCRQSTASAMELISLGRQLPALPQVEKAVEAGEIGLQHAAVIAESADRLGAESLIDRQTELVRAAEEVDPARLRLEVRRVEQEVDADRARREAEWKYRCRRLYVTTLGDGRVRVDGLLDPEGGAVIKTALRAALGVRRRDETRTEQQRRADAFIDIARRVLDGGPFDREGGERPHLHVVVDPELRRGTIDGIGPVAWETVERLLCDSTLSANGSSERRTFSPRLRRRIAAGRRSCQFPGCDRPLEWCEGHHLRSWTKQGKTTAGNGALICRFHHRLVHEGGWRLEREGAELVATSPDGVRYRSSKAPHAA